MENATIDIRLKASPELLDEMAKEWSRPLQVRALRLGNGEWVVSFRIPEGDEEGAGK